jgi:hypothetical protein
MLYVAMPPSMSLFMHLTGQGEGQEAQAQGAQGQAAEEEEEEEEGEPLMHESHVNVPEPVRNACIRH